MSFLAPVNINEVKLQFLHIVMKIVVKFKKIKYLKKRNLSPFSVRTLGVADALNLYLDQIFHVLMHAQFICLYVH